MKTLGLKLHIMLLVLLLVATLVASFAWIAVTAEERMLLSEALRRVVLEARNMALSSAKPLLHEDPEFELHPLVTRAIGEETDVVSIIVTNREGIVKGHRDVLQIDRPYAPRPDLRETPARSFAAPGEEIRENESIIEVAVPVTDQNATIGRVYLQYSKAGVHAAIVAVRARMMRTGFAAVAAGALVSLLLALHVTRPIRALTVGAEAIGAGRLDTRISVRASREIQVLAAAFNTMAGRLDENQRALIEQERIERELEIAAEIQATLLPARLPGLPGFELEASYRPASQVGGDYFDFIPIDEHRLMIIVGDVAGKGVPGLVVMTMVRILARALAADRDTPRELLRHLNVLLRKDMKRGMFVTLFCGLLDIRDRSLSFASAGHMPLIVFRASDRAAHAVEARAKPLGVFPDEVFSCGLAEQRITLDAGDAILQYTDGLNEARNAGGIEYGLDRLLEAASRAAGGGAKRIVADVLETLGAFRGDTPPSDDLTIVAVSVSAVGPQAASAPSDVSRSRTPGPQPVEGR